MFEFFFQMIGLCLQYICYDPNYNYDEDDDEETMEMEDEEEEGSVKHIGRQSKSKIFYP